MFQKYFLQKRIFFISILFFFFLNLETWKLQNYIVLSTFNGNLPNLGCVCFDFKSFPEMFFRKSECLVAHGKYGQR